MVDGGFAGWGAGFAVSTMLLAGGITSVLMHANDYLENKYLNTPEMEVAEQYRDIKEILYENIEIMDKYLFIDKGEVLIIKQPNNSNLEHNLYASIEQIKEMDGAKSLTRELIETYTHLENLEDTYPPGYHQYTIEEKAEYGQKYLEIRDNLESIADNMQTYLTEVPDIERIERNIDEFNKYASNAGIPCLVYGGVGFLISSLVFFTMYVPGKLSSTKHNRISKSRKKNRP